MFYINRLQGISEPVVFDVEVVTPMFLGGADKHTAELRSASIKGVLRFWWRALYGAQLSLDVMRKKEAEIFGNTENKSNLRISILGQTLKVGHNMLDHGTFNIYEYLAYGYRVKQEIKPYFYSGSFSIQIQVSKKFYDEVTLAFKCLLKYGGLGAKSRNGFGSLYSEKVTPFNIPENILIKNPVDFTAFSNQSRLFLGTVKDDWKSAMKEVGELYKNGKYQIKINNMRRELIAKPFKSMQQRHAKPYFLHIKKLSNGKFQGQILYLPYLYAPENKINTPEQQNYFKVCNKMNEYFADNMKGGHL